LFDEDRCNRITLNNLKKAANELGEDLSHEQLAEMLERASQNGKEITREDFYNIMIKKSL
jgi:Ca2+-binding EF-hand superfamily protein